jgi:hypothetical protein
MGSALAERGRLQASVVREYAWHTAASSLPSARRDAPAAGRGGFVRSIRHQAVTLLALRT